MKYFKIILFFLLCFKSNLFIGQSEASWESLYPSVWKATIGTPGSISLLKAAGAMADLKGLRDLPQTAFPLERGAIDLKVIDHKTYLRFPLERNEQIYGLGLNFQTVNQRGRILNLHVDHYGGTDNGRTHAPVPFYVSSKGYGVLIDAATYMTVYVGTAVRTDTKTPPLLQDRNTDKDWDSQPYSDAVEILVPADGATVYVFGGPTVMNVVQRYNLMNGGGCLPPKWGLGFTERVPTLFSQGDILKEVKSFEAHHFPLDFIGVEPGWQSMSYPCTFEWDKKRFPDPKGFLDSLVQHSVRANLWLNPYISPKASLYPALKRLSGSHTVWNGIVPDLTLAETRGLLKAHFMKHQLGIGVSGFKIDEVDGFDNWLWPDVATFPSGVSGEQMRQTYGLMVQNMTSGWFRELNQRTYGLVRASNAGASALPYVIYNDYYNHRDFITALVNSSFIGVLWTPEVRASKSAEEWVRRMQSVCFSPMAMLNAWSDGTKPWSFPEVELAVNAVADLRMRLLPYLYTTFAQYHFEGKPPFRAMALVEGFGGQTATMGNTINPFPKEIKDQYMMGDLLLVAPMFVGETQRNVYLPPGKWYDFYTGALVGEHQVVSVSPPLDQIPLFVRDGGIIPMVAAHTHAPKLGEALGLEVRHYGRKGGRFLLYDDDGVSFDYTRGGYSFTELVVEQDGSGVLKGRDQRREGKIFGYLEEVKWVFMTKKE